MLLTQNLSLEFLYQTVDALIRTQWPSVWLVQVCELVVIWVAMCKVD